MRARIKSRVASICASRPSQADPKSNLSHKFAGAAAAAAQATKRLDMWRGCLIDVHHHLRYFSLKRANERGG
jgi:hypothetical protein